MTGTRNRHMPTLMTVWKMSIAAMPTQMYDSNGLFARRATRTQRTMIAVSSAQRQQAPDHTQLLADGAEDEVRVPRRKAPRVAALRLGAVEIPLDRQLSAAEGHQAARLLPADALRVIVVVKDDVEALFHIAADLVVFPQQKKRDSAAEQTHHKPADGHARGKGDAGEDEDIDEGAAHIGGDLIIDADERQQMDAQHRDRRDALEVAVLP